MANVSATNLTAALERAKEDSGGWALRCVEQLVKATGVASGDFGFVSENGTYMQDFDQVLTWGIDYDACRTFCGFDKIDYPDFSFPDFANSFTNWLLPWLALLAQLPYQTGSASGDLVSLFFTIGSPALATYSLCLTLLKRYYVRRRFDDLRRLAADEGVSRRWQDVGKHLRHVRHFLQEAQQVPIRLSQSDGWLSSLLVCSENHKWWQRVSDTLMSTRKGWTYAFWAQTFAALVAWAFTVGGSAAAALGNEETALELSASTLWVWMLPLVSGWILVGTQSRASSIDDALRISGSHRALEQPDDRRLLTSKETQKGIVVRSGLTPQLLPQRMQTARTLSVSKPPSIPRWMGFSVLGDEALRGPIYNYARLFTWTQVSITITDCLRTSLQKIRSGQPVQFGRIDDGDVGLEFSDRSGLPSPPAKQRVQGGSFSSYADTSTLDEIPLLPPRRRATRPMLVEPPAPRWNDGNALKQNLAGDALHTAAYCALEPLEFRDAGERHEVVAYTPWQNVPKHTWKAMAIAASFALLVQWGAIGSSIMIAYNTPFPKSGLGCRSGGYTIYGLVGTIVWLLLTASMLFSHGALLRHQEEQQQRQHQRLAGDSNHNTDLPTKSKQQQQQQQRLFVDIRRSALSGLAVITRLLGKSLAVTNGIFLILHSFAEIIGLFDNCWCESIFVWRGVGGWVVVFKTNNDLVDLTESYWVAGIVLSAVACVAMFVFVALGSRDSADKED